MSVFLFYHGITSNITEVLALIRILEYGLYTNDLDELLALITIGALFYVFVIFQGLIEE